MYINGITAFVFMMITFFSVMYNMIMTEGIETRFFLIIGNISLMIFVTFYVLSLTGIIFPLVLEPFELDKFLAYYSRVYIYLLSLLYLFLQVKTYSFLKGECKTPKLFLLFLFISAFIVPVYLCYTCKLIYDSFILPIYYFLR